MLIDRFRDAVKRLRDAPRERRSAPNFSSKVRWWNNPVWLDRFERYLSPDGAGGHPHRILDRRFTLQALANSVRDLPGSTAECGVYTGVGSALICATLRETYGPAFHYGFDSFEGLPDPGEHDADWSRGQLASSLAAAETHLAEFPFIRLIRGWIPDTFGGFEDERFRLVHIDVDLERPTRDCLEFFYPRVVSGGLFVFDDYGFRSCPGARKAVDEFMDGRIETVVELVTGQAFFFKR